MGQATPTVKHVIGSLENDYDDYPDRTGFQIRCQCGWRVRGTRQQVVELSDAAVDHVCGLIETHATAGFLPVLDLRPGA